MAKIEIAELMQQDGKMMEWSLKVNRNLELSQEDKDIASVVDVWAKEIGEGKRDAYELSNFIVKTIEPEVYESFDMLLDSLFERGSVGEFDDYVGQSTKNNLIARRSARNGGQVDKSYVDYSMLRPTWEHYSVATEISLEKLRKGGYKTVAELTLYAEEALKNALFRSVFSAVDALITSPSVQGFVSASTLTKEALDSASDYLHDRGANPMFIGLSNVIRPITRIEGYKSYLSDEMKNELNKYGIIDLYNGVKLTPMSVAKKLSDGELILPDKKVFGIVGKIGKLDMRGSLRVYQTIDTNREIVDLKITGFEFGYMITDLENICKITISQ